MKIAVFSTRGYDRRFLTEANRNNSHELTFFETRLKAPTAGLAAGFPVVAAFVNDLLDAEVLKLLHQGGTRFIALRSAGFNHVDLVEAGRLGIKVSRVPAYSPHAVAEHTIGLILSLNRNLHRAYNRVREGNFMLDGLLGFDLHGKTAGVVGTGKIGAMVVGILRGFGCRVLAHDVKENEECRSAGASYATMDDLLQNSDIISLHCPLTPDTQHLINDSAVDKMREGVMLINTSRGGLVDTTAVTRGLKSGKIGYLGLDVYEEEGDLFFEDLSEQVIQDDVFSRLLTFPNVLITGHQAFFTKEAVESIATTTFANVDAFARGEIINEVNSDWVK